MYEPVYLWHVTMYLSIEESVQSGSLTIACVGHLHAPVAPSTPKRAILSISMVSWDIFSETDAPHPTATSLSADVPFSTGIVALSSATPASVPALL